MNDVGDPQTTEALAQSLGQTALFGGTSDALRARVAAHSEILRLPRGATLFEAGQNAEGVYVVLRGLVKLFARAENGQEKVIEVVPQYGHLGESNVFDQAVHVACARTLNEAEVLLVPAAVVLGELAQDPRLAARMLAGLSRRLNDMVRDIEALTLRSSVRRVVDYLVRAQAAQPSQTEHGGTQATVSLPFSKSTLASLLSVTPEHFSRILHELQSRGLIAVNRRDIHIPDVSRLAQAA